MQMSPMRFRGRRTEAKLPLCRAKSVLACGTARFYAAENVTAGKKAKYVEFDGVVRDWTKKVKTVTTLTVNWNKRHADTFSYFVTQPGYNGDGVRLHDQKPSEVYPDEDVKLNEDVDGVFLRSVLYPFTPGTLIEIR